MKQRPIYHAVWDELIENKSMVFLAGPRQAGKTTFAQDLTRQFANSLYFNWDIPSNKKQLIENPSFFEHIHRKDNSKPLIVLDEIHKYRSWKNYLKGTYDQFHKDYLFLVLGSGRLDVFQKGGDSLAGRYFLFHLWPLTLAELANQRNHFDSFKQNPVSIPDAHSSTKRAWENLSQWSGFPEPFFAGKAAFYQRWTQTYGQQLIREDIRNMTHIKYVDTVETLFSLLSSKVGSPLSMASLSEDIQTSFTSIRDWLEIFERFYLIFRLSPWTKKISRTITKEKKLYLFDYAQIRNPAAKFENMVALELFRAVNTWNDLGLGKFDLFYVRNKEKEEVDFLIADQNAPKILVEAKSADSDANRTLLKFQSQLDIPAVQLVNQDNVCKLITNNSQKLLIITAHRWLAGLP